MIHTIDMPKGSYNLKSWLQSILKAYSKPILLCIFLIQIIKRYKPIKIIKRYKPIPILETDI